MNTEELVSVITVCLNSEKTIRDTIEAVLGQTYKNIQYIIIDGKSQDTTLSIAESYRGRFEEAGMDYKIISEKDNGLFDAMNKGIGFAQGTIIGIINSDDWYEPDAIERVVDCYHKTNFDIFCGAIRVWKGKRSYIKYPKNRKFKTSRNLCHPAMFVTRNAYQTLGVYDADSFCADLDFWLRAFRQGRDPVVSSSVFSNYRLGGIGSDKSFRKIGMKIREKYKAYRKNNYSRLYIIECVAMETVKWILA